MNSIIISNDYYEIGLDEELNAITLLYKRKGTSVELRDMHQRLIEIFEKSETRGCS